MRKNLALLLALFLALSGLTVSFAEEAVVELPRNETLYFNGLQWGAPNNYNSFAMANTAWPLGDHTCNLMGETLYMYNMLTNENEPLLADGPIKWEDDHNILVKVKEAAKWNDGTALTAADVVYTFDAGNRYVTDWSDIWTYLEKVEAVDDYTVRFTLKNDPYNVYMLPFQLANTHILCKAFWEAKETEFGGDVVKLREFFNESPVYSGPYKLSFYDDTRVVLVRDDNYWGQDASMWGKLPSPKYVAHVIYQDNLAGDLAFSQGLVDVSQQFITNVWEHMEKNVDENGESLYACYLEELPYYLGAGMPSLIFNLSKPGLDDAVVRKAIALCLDYEAIGTNAMCGYTEDIIPSLFNLYLFGDYVNEDDEELLALRWDTTDLDASIETANAMLDEAGYADIDGDGFRELPDGGKIEWKAECPYGWADWNASLEILSESAKEIGLNIVTYFPEASVFYEDLNPGNFDICMNSPYPALSVAMPWQAAFNVLYGEGVPERGELASRNHGRFNNERVNELINEASAITDMERLVEIYTEIDKIFLTEMPTVPLMYRPQQFHTVYTGVWQGFAQKDDGTNTPPTICSYAAGIRDLYNISAK